VTREEERREYVAVGEDITQAAAVAQAAVASLAERWRIDSMAYLMEALLGDGA
jgi:hypothetical protein